MLNGHTQNKNQQLLIFLSIVLVSVAVRILTAEYIDIGGDNSEKWRQVHHLLEGAGYTKWYQQTVRWGIMLPLAGLMKTFGMNPVLNYVQPIFFSSLATGMLYLIGEKLHSRKLGITVALATIVFPQMAQTGSQLWPGVFELGYIALCVWLVLIWLESRSTTILVLAAFTFFLGWGCRVTMLYAAPGLALLIWLPTKELKPVLLCIGVIGGLIALEWLAFWQVTGNPMGRIGVLQGSHIVTAGLDISFTDYLLNIKKLTKLKGLIAIWALCFIASLYVGFSSDKRWRAIAWLYLIHALLLLYMVSSINPLKLAMPVGTRFWGVCAPFGLLVLFKALFDLKHSWPRTGTALITILFLVFIGFTIKKIPPVNSLMQLNRDYALLSPIFDANRPVIMRYEHWQPNFLEEHVIAAFTGKKGKRIPREDHVIAAIRRNQARMIALFVEDISKHVPYWEEPMQRLDHTSFLFIPPNATESDPAAEIIFGRKLHRAIPTP